MAKRRYQGNPGLEAVSIYRARFRRWTMEALPDMPDDQWQRLMAWVHAFGYQPGTPHGKNAAKRFASGVTATVTTMRRRKESVSILFKQQGERK